MSLSDWSLGKVKRDGVYVGLVGESGEPSTGGYRRQMIHDSSELAWTNDSEVPWDVSQIAIFDSPEGGQMIESFDAGRGSEPSKIRKNDKFKVDVSF